MGSEDCLEEDLVLCLVPVVAPFWVDLDLVDAALLADLDLDDLVALLPLEGVIWLAPPLLPEDLDTDDVALLAPPFLDEVLTSISLGTGA